MKKERVLRKENINQKKHLNILKPQKAASANKSKKNVAEN